jgi:copper chaperone
MQALILKVEGMSCGGCAKSVERALRALEGVTEVQVSLAEKNVVIDYDPQKQSAQTITQVIENSGFDVVNKN